MLSNKSSESLSGKIRNDLNKSFDLIEYLFVEIDNKISKNIILNIRLGAD